MKFNFGNKPFHNNYHKIARIIAAKTTGYFTKDQSNIYPYADRKYDYFYSRAIFGWFLGIVYTYLYFVIF